MLSLGISAQTIYEGTIGFSEQKDSAAIKAFAIDQDGTLATIAIRSAEQAKISVLKDGASLPANLIAVDNISRLTLLKTNETGAAAGTLPEIGSTTQLLTGDSIYVEKAGGKQASFAGWQKTFGGFLPFALMRLHYEGETPAPGTPLYDKDGKLVAIAHEKIQSALNANAGYALPIEVLERVKKGAKDESIMSRSWVGLLMEAENSIPVVSSIRPDSPAAKAGLQMGDILLKVGDRSIPDYASAVNAFYYLVANEPTTFEVLRGTEKKSVTVTSVVQPVLTSP